MRLLLVTSANAVFLLLFNSRIQVPYLSLEHASLGREIRANGLKCGHLLVESYFLPLPCSLFNQLEVIFISAYQLCKRN